MSSITTKVGDRGNTKLWSGEDVRKTDVRIDFCGCVDELVSVLGVCYATAKPLIENYLLVEIEYLQRELFVLASEVATEEPKRNTLKHKITKDTVRALEVKMAELEESITPAKGWILPGVCLLSAHLDVARCVARRCERVYVDLLDRESIYNQDGLIWLNRISDYLYLLARFQEETYRVIKHGRDS